MKFKLQFACMLAVLLAVVSVGGCAVMGAHPNHPGSVNTFDSTSYDALLVADSMIKTTRTDYLSGKVPAAIMPQVHAAFNDLVAAYGAADSVYITYHVAATQGVATVAMANAVTTDLTVLSADIAKVKTIRGTN